MTTGITNLSLGANAKISYLVQTAAGAIDASPAWKTIPVDSFDPQVQPNQLENNALTGHRDRLAPRSGTVNAQVTASGRLYPVIYEDLLEAAFQGTWGAKFALTGLEITVNETAKTFTRASGSWITDGVVVGDRITFSGFAETGPPDETPNNGTFVVTEVTSATVLTFGDATVLVDTAAARTVNATTPSDYLKVGSTKRKIAIEAHYSDADDGNGEYQRFVDLEVASIAFSVGAQGDVNMNLSLVGGTELDLGANIADEIAGATYTETALDFFDSFSGFLNMDASSVATITSMTPNIDNQSNPLFIIGSRYPGAVSHGKVNANIDVTVFYTDNTIKEKFQDEDDVAMHLSFANGPTGNVNTMSLQYPNGRIISFGRPVGGETEIIQNLTLQPYRNDDLETSVILQRYNPA